MDKWNPPTRLKHYRQHRLLEGIVARAVSTKAAAMVIALTVIVVGCVMIFQNIRDDGFIDVNTLVASGKLKVGLVGVLLVFFGMIIALYCIRSATVTARQNAASRSQDRGWKNQKIKIQIGNNSAEWEGQLSYWEESTHVAKLLSSVQRSFADALDGKAQVEQLEPEDTKTSRQDPPS